MRSLVLLAACASAPRDPIAWTTPIEIATGGGQKGPWKQNNSDFDYVDDPSVVLDANGAALVAWVDNKRKDVFFTAVDRDGRARGEAVNVSRSPDVFSWLPRLVVAGNDVFVLWQEIVFSGGTHGGEIFFARSRDGGVTFGEPLNLSNSKNGDGKARIDAKTWLNGSLDLVRDDSGTLYAAWTEYDGPLWLSRSTDDGASFSKPLVVAAGTPLPARAPALAAAAGVVYIAWTVGEDRGADVRIATSVDRGATFSEPVVVARTNGYSDAPKLATDRRGVLHVVFGESANGPLTPGHIEYTRSRDRARTFEPLRAISTATAGYPALALEGDHVVVSWELFAASKPQGLAVAYSRDGGASFSAPAIVDGSRDPQGGANGSHQGPLMRKLAMRARTIAIVNSALVPGVKSRVWLVRGRLRS